MSRVPPASSPGIRTSVGAHAERSAGNPRHLSKKLRPIRLERIDQALALVKTATATPMKGDGRVILDSLSPNLILYG
jgi:hypothetical protein